jgi:hypothetical protein
MIHGTSRREISWRFAQDCNGGDLRRRQSRAVILAACGGGGGGSSGTTNTTPPVTTPVPGSFADATVYSSGHRLAGDAE